ncbi:hypothetical protein HU200_028550 [Digitaria exilis]|uniref:Cleavage/polyadenylation specificity factor A subunit N-terminal domain-containing protein n=1 Tax=Digitaria exilis TaxID=1010633 RepID=A0A835BRU2_9POAL|nr:hypothetical protein HU200_028550 [Digitaria exilis]
MCIDKAGYAILSFADDRHLSVAHALRQLDNGDTHGGGVNGSYVSPILGKGFQGYFVGVLLSSSEEDGPRVMLVDHPGSKMKATIFSIDTGEVCSATPWVDIPACPDHHELQAMAVELNGSVYYLVENWRYIASIDTATMGIAVIELPQCVSPQSGSLDVGETKDGATCLVYTDGLDVGVLMHTRDDAADGIQKLVLDRVVSMDAELQRVLPAGQFDVLQVFAVRDGYVYLLASSATLQDPPGDRYWVLSLCLATMKLEKLFQGTYGCAAIPYIMPWPRSLFVN